MKYGKEYYRSQSIVGKLYREAVNYKKENANKLTNQFSNMNLNDNQLKNTPRTGLNSLV